MGLFGRKNKGASTTRPAYVPPAGLTTTPQVVVRSAPFRYDGSGKPAVSLDKVKAVSLSKGGAGVSLVKGHQASEQALAAVDLAGFRGQIIGLLDVSGSMYDEFQAKNGQLSPAHQLALRTLGFCLNIDSDEKIPVIMFGSKVHKPVDIRLDNFEQVASLLVPDFGGTPMTEAFEEALKLAESYGEFTVIVIICDGNPNNRISMSNVVVRSSGHPVFVKFLALKPVSYLEELDDLPSRYEIKRDDNGNPVKDGNGQLVIVPNPDGIRLIDNVDAQAINPYTATEAEFAAAIAEELSDFLEVAGRVGLLTGVPGVDHNIF